MSKNNSRLEDVLHVIFYRLLFVLLLGSVILFIIYLRNTDSLVWEHYQKYYLASVVIYLWFTFLLIFLNEIKKGRYPKYNGGLIAVVIPCYNEDPKLLLRSLASIYFAGGNKEIYIVDDGSTNDVQATLRKIERKRGIHVYYSPVNRGKRHAIHYAIKNMIADADYIVTVDSDTVIAKDALEKIVEPLERPKVGAVSGDVRLLNENQNTLTKMTGAYYWKGLNIHRSAQSPLGMVGCCSGCLAAYRPKILYEIIDDFASQHFLGQQCTYGDDRHLTNLVLKKGYDVVFRPEAVSYTYTPETLRGFLKQQMRWKRSYIRESSYALSFTLRRKPVLFFEVLLFDLTMPFLSVGLVLASLLLAFTQPLTFLRFLLPSWLAYTLITNLPLIIRARDKTIGAILYSGFYIAVLHWQLILALFTLRERRWSTR